MKKKFLKHKLILTMPSYDTEKNIRKNDPKKESTKGT